MTREIKFRVWNPKYKEFSTWGFMSDGHFKGIPTGSHMSIDECRQYSQQFTGLKDKNGVEIYEGDIVKAENWNTKVFHTEFILAPVVFSYGQYWLQTPAGLHSLYDTNGEVIGNIYQNPELLKR